MGCELCGRSTCIRSFHSIEEQEDHDKTKDDVMNERDVLRARIEVLEKAAEAVVAGCPCCDGKGFTVSVSLATVDDPEQEQCQFCYYARAAIDAAKEG